MQIFGHRKCKVFAQKERNSLIYSISTKRRKMKKNAEYNSARKDGEKKKRGT